MIYKQDKKQTKTDIIIRRFTAILIDYLILSIYAGILFMLSPIFSSLFQESALKSEFFGFVLLVTPVFLYFFLFEASPLKGTPGKCFMHLKVIKLDGTNFSYKNSFWRSLVKFIPWEIAHFALWQFIFPNSTFSFMAMPLLVIVNFLGVLYIAFPLLNRRARAIHDYASHSVLIIK